MIGKSLFLLLMAFFWPARASHGAGIQLRDEVNAESPYYDGKTFHSSVELRHHLNSYYDQEGYLDYQNPAAELRIRLGARFYQNAVDVFATAGAIKLPKTQQVLQRRPEIELNVFPLRGVYGRVLAYGFVQLPFSETGYDDSADFQPRQGSIYTVGLAPFLVLEDDFNDSRLGIKAGFDGSSKLYSRKQYIGEDPSNKDRDHFDEKFTLTERTEDRSMQYAVQYMAGFTLSPAWLRMLKTEGAIFYDLAFYPVYSDPNDPGEDYYYSSQRESHYRVRMQYAMTERLTFVNDFYHYHQGFFEAKNAGDKLRLQNVFRLAYDL